MIYLDYAADTPAREEALSTFADTARRYPANPNSPHPMGREAAQKLAACTESILSAFALPGYTLIYTSGATEANNLAIKGAAGYYRNRGKHIVTTYLEHSSVHGPVGALRACGYEAEYAQLRGDGKIDMEALSGLLRPDTALVSCCYVDGELGIVQEIGRIGKYLKETHPDTLFHVDATQAAGKLPVAFGNADLVSFAAHKFYGPNGVGALAVRPGVMLEPQMNGGISTTPFRSGSPALALIAAMDTALTLAYTEMEENLARAGKLNAALRQGLAQYRDVVINSPEDALPYFLNLSLTGRDAPAFLEKLGERGFSLSGKSACTAPKAVSRPVFALTQDRRRALSTVRVSTGRYTAEADIGAFLAAFSACYRETGRK